jgi:hypothetical protein
MTLSSFEATFDFDSSRVRRHPKAQFREVGDEIFLVHPDGEQIYNLNPMAAALWRLLKSPITGRDMAQVVMAAFPIMAPAKVEGDVKNVLTELLGRGFARIES